MKNQSSQPEKEVWLVKVVIRLVVIIACLVLTILAPKQVFADNLPFQLASSMAITSDTNYILYDYDVYSTEIRFNTGLEEDVKIVKSAFIDRKEIMAVKIHGDSYKVSIEDDYVMILDPSVPELNIEYYLVKNLFVADVSIPCRTFILLFTDISRLINNIYLIALLIISFSIIGVFAIKLTKNIVGMRNYQKLTQKP